MSQVNRIGRGRHVDRSKPINFVFNGRHYTGCQGDTVASALLANDVAVVARSWKYHRPRGIVSCGVEEPNALLQLEEGADTIPNARATEVELYEGLRASSVNCWPSVDLDLMSVTGMFSRFMPAGFYYKTFMWPKSFWMKYEHFIRKASGLGVAPAVRDPAHYDKTDVHCDVLVVGGGPAGLAAALAAGRSGARVILAHEQNELGGSLLGSTSIIDDQFADAWIAAAVAELKAMKEVRLLTRSTVFGYHDHNFLTICERLTDHLPLAQRSGARERLWRVRARQVVLATGAIERPLVFSNNDRPGIMLASAVSAYANRYGVVPGSKVVIFTNNDSAYQSAFDLSEAGVKVVAIVDARAASSGYLPACARRLGIEIIAGSVVIDTAGRKRIKGVDVMRLRDAGNEVAGPKRHIACDLLALSGGWSPVVHLHAQSGGKPRFDDAKACFVPAAPVQAERSAGACNGSFALADCLREGAEMGTRAARLAGFEDARPRPAPVAQAFAEAPIRPLWVVPAPRSIGRVPKQFVDLQNDVGASDIVLAAREGYHSIEHVKRYTALGFGTDQGKLGNINGMGILAQALGQDIASTGTTAFRPNYTPVTFGAIAGPDLGELFDPIRKTAMHEWHEQHGALFENVGQWKRPWYYPKAGESLHDAVNRECLATRASVGIMDASTLGKIDIQGPDAATFLNWVYTNAWTKLGVGRCRYGLMLDENGMVMDDGVTVRLGETHFVMTTTTGGAARVMSWLERWLQTEWPHLLVHLTSVTDHWATMAVVGPNSRKVLQKVCSGVDFSSQSFPFMAYKEGTVAGVPARIMRISFSGELAYEINIDANYGRHVWEAVMAAGAQYDITPYGTETMHVLRAEKGFIIVGQDTDGSVTPVDLDMDWIIGKGKDFIGRRSLSRADTAREGRKQLVGLLTDDPAEVLPEGGQIVDDPNVALPVPMLGHVTSSYYSACLGRSIAMALVKGGLKRMGEKVRIPLAGGRVIDAVITSPVFIDPEGARQNV
ncbi:MAG: sarcosine oxidase subunit alpha family protein [Telluria sp.]|nr:sarcosine oxidase subunit alpha family protein [Telluria sp.]